MILFLRASISKQAEKSILNFKEKNTPPEKKTKDQMF